MSEVFRTLLEELADALRDAGDVEFADEVRDAASSDQLVMLAFLVSDELWGGSGSIADSAGIDGSSRSRARVETALVRLGKAQLERGVFNPRTAKWVTSFAADTRWFTKWRNTLGF